MHEIGEGKAAFRFVIVAANLFEPGSIGRQFSEMGFKISVMRIDFAAIGVSNFESGLRHQERRVMPHSSRCLAFLDFRGFADGRFC